MKAFLLAAGHGTRLHPLTYNLPKCLVPIRGVPMLQIWLETCKRFGINELLVNVHAHADAVRRFLGNNGHGITVKLSEEITLLGSAGTLLQNRNWIKSEPCFWVFYADVLTTTDLNAMLAHHKRGGQIATLGLYRVSDPSGCGIATVDGSGIISSFIEKPEQPVSNLAFSGIMLASPAIMDYIPKELPADIGFHVLPRLATRMSAYLIHEYLLDIGTLPNYQSAQLSWPGLPQKNSYA